MRSFHLCRKGENIASSRLVAKVQRDRCRTHGQTASNRVECENRNGREQFEREKENSETLVRHIGQWRQRVG